MAFDARHRAQFWLFQAGVDPDAIDTSGLTIARSLAQLLEEARATGRREAATRFLTPSIPPQVAGELARSTDQLEGDTGSYEVGQLEAALTAAIKRP